MSTSEVSIANFALAHLGHSKTITALSERSNEARACNLWYAQCRDEVLRDFPWPFAVTTADLALVEATPNGPEWGYTYAYPSDALALTRAPYGSTRNPTPETLTRYRIGRRSGGGKLLYMDQDSATIEYIAQVTDPNEFPPDFVAALSYLLASRICAQVTSDTKQQNTTLMYTLYREHIGRAKANAANESSPDVQPESGYITARD